MSGATRFLPVLGRLLIAALFLFSGAHKLANPNGVIGFIGRSGLPFPPAALVVALACELGGGMLLAVGYRAQAAAVALALFSTVAALAFHHGLSDFDELIDLLKDVAIVGGLLQIAVYGAGNFSIDAFRSRPPG
jgi:putative oxidoreductase